MNRRAGYFLALASLASLAQAQEGLRAEVFVDGGISQPVALIQDPTRADVQYVVQKEGRIRILKNGVIQARDFLNLESQVNSYGERGLLGLEFAPDYRRSGHFYVLYYDTPGNTDISNTRVARFRRLGTAGLLVVDPRFRQDIITVPQTPPYNNHKGGTLRFGRDGYLYIGLGDGGPGTDPLGRGQDPTVLLGKMLRLDVSRRTPGYRIPPGNPFVGADPYGARDEIWAFGFRNPFKFSFDRPTGAMLLGDVGEGSREEVNYEPAGRGGRNYGWRVREGFRVTGSSGGPYSVYTDPIIDLNRDQARSITGGYVYRGRALGPDFYGRYIFADFVYGKLYSLRLHINPLTGEATASDLRDHTGEIGVSLGGPASIDVDENGELYVSDIIGNRILRITRPPVP